MECFHHEGRPAVGACRSCLKGVCRECATELEGGLACSPKCERMIGIITSSLEQGARYQHVSAGLLRSTPSLWSGLAVVALIVGIVVAGLGMSLPAFRSIALLALPFLALAFLSGRLARSVAGGRSPVDVTREPAS
jgi:hypothetical protein